MDSIYIKLNNVNDYETLSKDCVYLGSENSHFDQIKGETTATISPADCLSCSGCLTTSEELLVNDQTSKKVLDLVNNEKEKNKDYLVVCNELALVSLFLANDTNITCMQEYFHNKGIANLITNNIGKGVLLDLMLNYSLEFTNKNYPLLSSECPSFVLYLKKQLGNALENFLFPFPSSDQITKLILLDNFGTDIKILGLNQCVDNKLENINNEQIKDADIIGTPYELFKDNRIKYDFEIDVDNLEDQYLMKGLNGSLVYSFINKFTIAKFRLTKNKFKMKFNKIRTGFVEVYSEFQGERLAEGIRVEGINNIVFLVNKLKTKKNNYLFAEMMACPEGCTFGSGLNKFEELNNKSLKEKLLNEKLLKWKSYKENKKDLLKLDNEFIEKYNIRSSIETVYNNLLKCSKQYTIETKRNSKPKPEVQNFEW